MNNFSIYLEKIKTTVITSDTAEQMLMRERKLRSASRELLVDLILEMEFGEEAVSHFKNKRVAQI
jgi:hypothetical protein